MVTRTAELSLSTRRGYHLTRRKREHLAFLVFALPNLILLGIWIIWPFIHSLYLSLTNWRLLTPEYEIVGLSNYARLLESPVFWKIARNTVIFSLGTTSVRLTLALALAVLLNQKLFARGMWRLIIFSPHITTSAAMALVWLSMYTPRYGVFANVLSTLGLKLPAVLSSTEYALPAIMLVAIWKGLGFSTVIFLAALQGVDPSLKEAGAIDGANSWQSFWNISFPAISPMTYFLLVTGLAKAFATFDIVAVMTGGGPANATNLFVYQIYNEAFSFQRIGVASALAVFMLVIIMAFTYVQTRFKKRWVSY